MSETPGTLLRRAAFALGAILVVSTAASLDPDPRGLGTHEQMGLHPCGFYLSTGRPCFSCGMTTAFASMASLRPLDALAANPLGTVLFCIVAAIPLWLLHATFTGASPLRIFYGRCRGFILPGFLILLALSWLWKLWTAPSP